MINKLSVAILLVFGLCVSAYYWHYHQMPNPDAAGFVAVGRSLWHFELPRNFFRAPVYGLIVYPLSFLMPGPHPAWHAALAINAILYPINGVLVFLVARRLVGKAAFGIALLATVNPWTVSLMTEPVCETMLISWILVTTWMLLRGSSWAYVAAAVATMVRYDAAGLILAAFLVDAGGRRWLKAFAYSALASVPLGLWMVGTHYNLKVTGYEHYVKLMDWSLLSHMEGWLSLVRTALWPIPEGVPLAILFYGILVWGMWSLRCWFLLAFVLPYLIVHQVYEYHLPRMVSPVLWAVFIFLRQGLRDIFSRARTVATGILVGTVAWSVLRSSPAFIFLWQGLRDIFSQARTVATGILVGTVALYVVSLSPAVVGDGLLDVEFKLLVEWYANNALPGEKLLCTMSTPMVALGPQYEGSILGIGYIQAASPDEYYRKCKEQGITYVCWDSRMACKPTDLYYKLQGFANVAHLSTPEDTEQYRFVTQIWHPKDQERWINVFAVR